MQLRNKLVVVIVLAGCISLFILLLAKSRSHTKDETFTGYFKKNSNSQLRCPPVEFFDDLLTQQLVHNAIVGDRAGVQSTKAAGANVNKHGKQGVTPLIVTLLNFSWQGFDLLLNAGADPNLHADNGDSAITVAAIMPDSSYLQSALKHGGRVDDPDSHGRTPLMLAAARARGENVRLLLEFGANVHARDGRGNFPLIFAMQSPQPDQATVKLLIGHGARVADVNPAGLTARDYAAAFENPTLLKWLSKP